MSDKKLQIHITNDPIYMENGYTVYYRDGGACWVIDPGLPPQADEILAHISEHELSVDAIVLTHAHADHIAGIDAVRNKLGELPVFLARQEWAGLTDPMENLSGLMGPGFTTNVTDPKDLPEGTPIVLEGTSWDVLDTSGHSPGGRTLYCAELGIAFSGDALFAGGVGRVDFPHSDGKHLIANILEKLMVLPDETRVLSGHGPETTIGHERKTNPFVLHGL